MENKSRFLKLGLVGLLTVIVVGCSNGGGSKSMANLMPKNDAGTCPAPETCSGGCFDVLPKKCCDDLGRLINSPPDGCSDISQAFHGPANSSLGQMANLTNTGETAAARAAGLESDSSAFQTGGNSSAATAADRLARQDPKSAAVDNGSIADSSNPENNFSPQSSGGGSRGSGGGAASGGGGGGGLGAFGAGVKTDPASRPSSMSSPVPATDSNPAYSGGGTGGGSRGAGGGYDHGSPFGGGDAARAGGQDTLELGRSLAGNQVMGSMDPDEYFTMLKPTDNLFKVVERRYTTKAKSWALTDASQARDAVKKLVK